MPVRLLMTASVAVALLAAAVRAQPLPPPQELAARHDSLIGGRAALEPHTSLRLVGSFSIPDMGLDAPLEILKLRPDRYLMRAALGPLGELLSGYDGRHAWTVQPGVGAMLLDSALAQQMARQADFFGDLHDYSRFVSVETLPVEEFDGRRVHPVRMVGERGDTLTEYFDASTGLAAGSRTAMATPAGRMETTSVVGEYRTFGGYTVATRIEQRNPQYRLVITISAVEFDTLDAAALEPPEAVRLLIKP